ncbi:MAG: hypothetical protein JWP00_1389 [Chloroflexi bacterium]|jgi:hypothetical protein|nr:hypothetical protein [Chloroflexota bacterium]
MKMVCRPHKPGKVSDAITYPLARSPIMFYFLIILTLIRKLSCD